MARSPKKKSAPKAAAKKKAAPKAKTSAKKPSKAVKRSTAKAAPPVERASNGASEDNSELEHSQAALDLLRAAKQAALARLLRR